MTESMRGAGVLAVTILALLAASVASVAEARPRPARSPDRVARLGVVVGLFAVVVTSLTGCSKDHKLKSDFDDEARALNPLIDRAHLEDARLFLDVEDVKKRLADGHVEPLISLVAGTNPKLLAAVNALDAIRDELPSGKNEWFDRARDAIGEISEKCESGTMPSDPLEFECIQAIDDAVRSVDHIAVESRRVGSTIHVLRNANPVPLASAP